MTNLRTTLNTVSEDSLRLRGINAMSKPGGMLKYCKDEYAKRHPKTNADMYGYHVIISIGVGLGVGLGYAFNACM